MVGSVFTSPFKAGMVMDFRRWLNEPSLYL